MSSSGRKRGEAFLSMAAKALADNLLHFSREEIVQISTDKGLPNFVKFYDDCDRDPYDPSIATRLGWNNTDSEYERKFRAIMSELSARRGHSQ
jgi:hypothetical protein